MNTAANDDYIEEQSFDSLRLPPLMHYLDQGMPNVQMRQELWPTKKEVCRRREKKAEIRIRTGLKAEPGGKVSR